MLRPSRNFNLKILGWFWLTVLLVILSIAIPAWLIGQWQETDSLLPAEQKLLQFQKRRIERALVRTGGKLRRLGMHQGDNTRSPFHWFIIDEQMQVFAASIPPDPRLVSEFEQESFWYFAHGDNARRIKLNDIRLIGPVNIQFDDHQDLQLIMWRPERAKFFSSLRTMPLWLILLMFAVVTSLMSWLLVRSIAAPLNRLGRAFQQVGQGHLSHRVQLHHPQHPDRHYIKNDQFARLFDEFNQMAERIEALIQNQKRQSADISHELRTPLTRLQMTLALVRNKTNEEALLPLIARAEKENELLNLHIQHLSELTTMEARAIQAGRQVSTVEDLLGELCEDAAFEAQERHITWHHRLVDAQIQVYIEPFITALENIVRNAFKYAKNEVSLECKVTHRQVRIQVTDNGPGVSEQELAKLTQAFYRTDSARHSNTGGLGLGLAIAAEAMRLNSGELHFEQIQPNGGLQVCLSFPIVQAAHDK